MLNFLKDAMAPITRSHKEAENKAQIKGYKITDNERSRKFGIGASSLQMLKDKAKLKFPVSLNMFFNLHFCKDLLNFLNKTQGHCQCC